MKTSSTMFLAILALLPPACGEKAPSSTESAFAAESAAKATQPAAGATGTGKADPGTAQGLLQSGQAAAEEARSTAGRVSEAAGAVGAAPERLAEAQQQAADVVQRAEGVLQDVTGGVQDPAAAPDVELEYKPVALSFAPDGPVKDDNLGNFVVEMEIAIDGTSIGNMVFQFWPEKAPITVRNFLRYSQEGFYNGLGFHRIIKGFMVQGGDPNGDGTGQGKYGRIKGEFSADPKYSHLNGVISMARSQPPNSASCQFFICNAAAKSLDGQYASFGQLVWGRQVLEKMSSVPVTESASGEQSKPTQKVTIVRAEVYRKRAWQAEEERRRARNQQQKSQEEAPKPQGNPQ